MPTTVSGRTICTLQPFQPVYQSYAIHKIMPMITSYMTIFRIFFHFRCPTIKSAYPPATPITTRKNIGCHVRSDNTISLSTMPATITAASAANVTIFIKMKSACFFCVTGNTSKSSFIEESSVPSSIIRFLHSGQYTRSPEKVRPHF